MSLSGLLSKTLYQIALPNAAQEDKKASVALGQKQTEYLIVPNLLSVQSEKTEKLPKTDDVE
jgi:hypothetical protein